MQVYADEMERRVQALVEEAQRLGQEATQAETSLQNLETESAQKLVDQAARLAHVRTPT